MNKTILYLTSSFPFGKGEVWACNEINSLIEQGNEVIIIPRTGKGKIINKDAIKFSSNLIDLPFMNWLIFLSLLRNILFNPLSFLKLLTEIIKQSNFISDFIKGLIVIPKSLFLVNILINKKIDHIHSFSTTSTAVVAFILSSKIKVPWSYTLHTSATLKPRFKRSTLFQSRSALICRTISQRTANDLSHFIGPSLSKKISMIHLGVDVGVFKKETTTSNDPFIIATPAGLMAFKGHIYSIEAAKELINLGVTNFKWFFYGSGPLLNELKKKVKELNLIDHCYFLGNIDHSQLLKKYENNEIDLVVLSSVSTDIPEGIPVSLMEAMSFSIPVIATDSGGALELIGEGCGVVVQQKNSIELAKEIKKLIEDNKYCASQGENGRNKIMEEFDTQKTSKQLYEKFFNN
tara:strand:+ start:9781 stop:10995 length:1215 start_codon:yes stop_codon:yes gene_type:complete